VRSQGEGITAVPRPARGWPQRTQSLARIRRILCATDFSPASERALQTAIELAKSSGAELLIAHAYHPPNLSQAEAVASGVYEEWDQNLRDAVAQRLGPLLESARRQLVPSRPLILSGAPSEAILEAAEAQGVDLIVVGTHQRTGIARVFLGSVAARIISAAHCPVLTVRGEP